ncbi:MAG TPA: FHA domain-containing protein [Actinomycetales bacterium]|nr:FHA domain-containing protein [Actinomycetales bacterium]
MQFGHSAPTEPAPSDLTPDEAVIASLPATSALLIVAHGPNVGARFLLDSDQTTVGRRESADIFLDDVTVSRKHAEFVRSGTRFTVQDVGSLNGTYVNRDRIDSALLAAGDEVQIGKFRMIFHPGDQGAEGSGN